jgi:hypothetical protein
MKGELKYTAIPTPLPFYFTIFSHQNEWERGYGAQKRIKCRCCSGNRAKRKKQRDLMITVKRNREINGVAMSCGPVHLLVSK